MAFAKIGIIGAMKEEIEQIRALMENMFYTTRAGIAFFEGCIHGQQIVLCQSGVGKVNAAVTTQILCETYDVEAIVFIGVAGAVAPELEVGDIVVSTDCIQHDIDATALGFEPGVIPFDAHSVFISDQGLRELAYETALALYPGQIKLGRILSGDQFIASVDRVRKLYEQFAGSCTEMEGAAVAQVCVMNELPFVIIRSMSDKADGSAPVNFAQFTLQAAERSFRIVEGMLKRLSS